MHIQSLGYNQGTAIIIFIINYVIKGGGYLKVSGGQMSWSSQSRKYSKSSTA